VIAWLEVAIDERVAKISSAPSPPMHEPALGYGAEGRASDDAESLANR
jgi:hypothetical protein